MADVAGMLTRALVARGTPIVGVAIGTPDDRATWRIDYQPSATAQQQADAAAFMATFDPTAPAVIDADTTALSSVTSRHKDVLATVAWAIQFKDPAAWAAKTPAQKRTQVLAEADNWRDIRVFIEKNL